MGKSDEDDDDIPKGWLVEEDPNQEILFSGRRRGIRSTRMVLFNDERHRTFHASLTSSKRGKDVTRFASRQNSLGAYILRRGPHEARSDEVLAKGGADLEHVEACVRRVREAARNWNSAVTIRIVIELPNELPLDGQIAIANFETKRLAESGRPAIWAIHRAAPQRRKAREPDYAQDHLHLIAPARPIWPLYGVLVVGRGKYLADLSAIGNWREGLAAAVNQQLAVHGLLGKLVPRWSGKKLWELGVDRPTKMRLSARAALRDEPDLTHPADQLALAWNAAIDRGEDPMRCSLVREELERRSRNRIREALLRDIAEQQSGTRKRAPNRAAVPHQARTETKPAPSQLELLTHDEIAEIELAHWRLGLELSPAWSSTQEGRETCRDRVKIYHAQIDRIFFRSGYRAPPPPDGKTLSKIYLQVPEDRQRDAIHLGANIEWKDKVYISSDAPLSVIDRLLRKFPKREIPIEPSPVNAQLPSPNGELVLRALEGFAGPEPQAPATTAPQPPKPPVQPQPIPPPQSPPKGETPMMPKPATPPTPTSAPAAPQPVPLAIKDEERAAAAQRVAALNDATLLATYSVTAKRALAFQRIFSKTTAQIRESAQLRNGSGVLFQEIRRRKLQIPVEQTRQAPRRGIEM